MKKKGSIEVCDCLFHLWGLQGLFQGHRRDDRTHKHAHKRTDGEREREFRIDPSTRFQPKEYSQIGQGVRIHLLPQYMSDFIFTGCLASHCGQKRNANKAYYTFVQFTAKYVLLNVSLF